MTTITDRGLDIDVLRGRLEHDYEWHTQQLTHLSTMSDNADPWLNAELINGSRQVLADIARALQAMAEDRYGVCVACWHDIAVERLRARPEARYCVLCQRKQHRG
jgi:DnaK suppressor protein